MNDVTLQHHTYPLTEICVSCLWPFTPTSSCLCRVLRQEQAPVVHTVNQRTAA